MTGMRPVLLVLVGPTAVGKTETALDVAKRIDAEIISADSMQIYKYMDIGTAKPSGIELARIPHHMIDVIKPDEDFSVADYKDLALKCAGDIVKRGKIPLLTGGTGLYINSMCYNYTFSEHDKDEELRGKLREQAIKYGNNFLHGRLEALDPESAGKIHPNNLRRVIRAIEVTLKTGKPFSYYEQKTRRQSGNFRLRMFGLTRARPQLYLRINERVDHMMELGFVEEVEGLLNMGYSRELNSMQGLGYRQIVNYIDGTLTKEDAVEQIATDTRRFAKRQYTWFLRDKNIEWVDASDENRSQIVDHICRFFEGE